MEIERRIEKWNDLWMIVAGRVVCTGCLESQALEDCERPFLHAGTCEASHGKRIPVGCASRDPRLRARVNCPLVLEKVNLPIDLLNQNLALMTKEHIDSRSWRRYSSGSIWKSGTDG